MCISILSFFILIEMIQLKAKEMLFQTYSPAVLFVDIYGKGFEVFEFFFLFISSYIKFNSVTCYFCFINYEPIYETEYITTFSSTGP